MKTIDFFQPDFQQKLKVKPGINNAMTKKKKKTKEQIRIEQAQKHAQDIILQYGEVFRKLANE